MHLIARPTNSSFGVDVQKAGTLSPRLLLDISLFNYRNTTTYGMYAFPRKNCNRKVRRFELELIMKIYV